MKMGILDEAAATVSITASKAKYQVHLLLNRPFAAEN